jgi:Flp pilus assembly protein TadB
MTSVWHRLSRWAYGLEARRRWVLWVLLALVAAMLLTALPSPWSWVATLPIAAFGVLLFAAQERRQRDEAQRGEARHPTE